jgi:hypothetical protein
MSNTRKIHLTMGLQHWKKNPAGLCAAARWELSVAAAADDFAGEAREISSHCRLGDCHTPGYLLGKPDISRSAWQFK